MPWLIKTKGRQLHSRDGASGPLYVIDDARWYPFEHLPPGTDPLHDGDLICRETDSLDGLDPAPVLAKAAEPSISPGETEAAALKQEAKKARKKPRVR